MNWALKNPCFDRASFNIKTVQVRTSREAWCSITTLPQELLYFNRTQDTPYSNCLLYRLVSRLRDPKLCNTFRYLIIYSYLFAFGTPTKMYTGNNILRNIDQMMDKNKITLAKVHLIQRQMMGVMKGNNEMLDQSEQYQKEITKLKKDIETLQKENSANKEFIQQIQHNWAALNQEISEMMKMNNFFEENIVRLKNRVTSLETENTDLKKGTDNKSTFLNNKIFQLMDKVRNLEGENTVLKSEVTKLEACDREAKENLCILLSHQSSNDS